MSTSTAIRVLQAILRLSRRRKTAALIGLPELVSVVGDADEAAVRRALFTLAQSGLIQRTPAGLRLTLPGLAIAVASPKAPTRKPLPRPRTLPLARSSRRAPRAA
jgi:hypothetical protein